MPSRRVALLVVVGAALAAFAVALRGAFVNWDDAWIILRNPYIRGLRHLGDVLDPFSERVLMGAEYLPLRDLSNTLDFALFRLEPTGYRLGNWLLYGLSTGLAYLFLLEALRSPRAALAGALLWAVHPLHSEVVAWASARKDLLNAVFALLAGTLHLRSARTGSRATAGAAAGAFLLATLSKSAAAALPFLLAGWEVLSGDAAVPLVRRARAALLRAAPMMALAIAGALLNSRHQDKAWITAEWRGGDWLANLFVMGAIHLRYLRQVVVPTGLAVDYPVGEENAASALGLAGVGVALALLGLGTWLAARRARAGLALLWWFALLAPVSNVIVPITNASADRYLFLPSLGACALAGLAWERIPARRAAAAGLAAVALLLGGLAARQCLVWKDKVALWTHATEVSPGVGRVWMNYGEALSLDGRNEEAIAAYREMVRVEPQNPLYWVQAGNQLYEIAGPSRIDEVEAFLRTGVEKAPPDAGGAHVALACIVLLRGRRAESVALLQEAVRRQPDLAHAHLNLGLWHMDEKRYEPALEEIREAVRIGLPLPDEIYAHDRLHAILEALGRTDEARAEREERERLSALTRGE